MGWSVHQLQLSESKVSFVVISFNKYAINIARASSKNIQWYPHPIHRPSAVKPLLLHSHAKLPVGAAHWEGKSLHDGWVPYVIPPWICWHRFGKHYRNSKFVILLPNIQWDIRPLKEANKSFQILILWHVYFIAIWLHVMKSLPTGSPR